jgi:hypothetical protein
MWRPGKHLGREEARGHHRPAGDFISRVAASPQGRDLVEVRLTLAEDFEVLVFMAYGPDRERVRLARSIGDEGSATLRLHTGQGWGPSRERTKLGRGDEVVLYIRYLV